MTPPGEGASLARGVVARDRPSVAAALNLVEDRRPAARREARALLAALPRERLDSGGHLVGLTGAPGAGKSTLAAALARGWRAEDRTVGVLAVDPTSPISGGSLLGDRLRMLEAAPDPEVFIRSLAGRGEGGGLAAEVGPMSWVLLAAYDVVLVETIGVGQTETDVAESVDTTCLVVPPGAGDTIQFLKAGVLEVPDVVAVNKADLGGVAERTLAELRGALPRPDGDAWERPVLSVSARAGTGVDGLAAAMAAHRGWLRERGRLERGRAAQRARWGVRRLREEFGRAGLERLGGGARVAERWAASDGGPLETLERLRRELS